MSDYDLAGIGLGPFNLSLAALLQPVSKVGAAFFERRPRFQWHPGLMFPGSKLQTSHLKDLVTAVDPTSPYSFLAYLVHHRRFYQFLTADFPAVERREFANYLQWAAERMDGVWFGRPIQAVRLQGRDFLLEGPRGRCRARHLVLGAGRVPDIPDWAYPCLGERCFHAAYFLNGRRSFHDQQVVVVGGGQTGAEVVYHLLSGRFGMPRSVVWVTRRPNFEPLDDSPFTNELFTPAYVEAFHGLPESQRERLLEEHKLAGDGISEETLQSLYQMLYVRTHLDGYRGLGDFRPRRTVQGIEGRSHGFDLSLHNDLTGESEQVRADQVVLSTGYTSQLPDCLEPIADRLERDAQGRPRIDAYFRILWNGPEECRLYVQNGGRHSHGIAEPQLSLAAWRSAVIVNDLLGESRYDTGDAPPWLSWPERGSAPDGGEGIAEGRFGQAL